MFSKKQRAILQEIIKDIEGDLSVLFEQTSPPTPPDPSLTPPTSPDPAAPPPPPGAPPPPPPATDPSSAASSDEDAGGEDVKKQVETLSKQPDEDIRKTFLAKLQNGVEKKDVDKMLSYIEQNKNTQDDSEDEIPANILRVVDELAKDFGIKLPSPKAVTTESKLQKLTREYLHYKKLYLGREE